MSDEIIGTGYDPDFSHAMLVAVLVKLGGSIELDAAEASDRFAMVNRVPGGVILPRVVASIVRYVANCGFEFDSDSLSI